MTFKIKQPIITISTVEVDLMTLPYHDWPEEAKAIARNLFVGRHAHQILEMLPETRKGWLVAQVEAVQALQQEFEL